MREPDPRPRFTGGTRRTSNLPLFGFTRPPQVLPGWTTVTTWSHQPGVSLASGTKGHVPRDLGVWVFRDVTRVDGFTDGERQEGPRSLLVFKLMAMEKEIGSGVRQKPSDLVPLKPGEGLREPFL